MNIGSRELRNCPRCGKVFVRVVKNLCPDCLRAEGEMIDNIRHYLQDHRGASLGEVVEATGAPEELVLRLIREGRILVSETKITVKCERCGQPISEGRFCNSCKVELTKGLGIAQPPLSSRPGAASQNSTGYHVETRKNPRADD